MLREEFEKRTGFYPTQALYAVAEEYYMKFSGDKDAFCSAYKKNKDGLAEKIQLEADMRAIKAQDAAQEEAKKHQARIAALEKELECEQEWRIFVATGNVTQCGYAQLVCQGEVKIMSDEEAKDMLYEQYGFAKEKVRIIHSVRAYEKNRHGEVRDAGEHKRMPIIRTSGYGHYIRFDCGRMEYELHNGKLNEFQRI